MMQQPNLPERRKRIVPTPKVEHGDWRVHVAHPSKVLYQHIPPLSIWKKLHLRVEYLQNTPAQAYASMGGAEDLSLEQCDIRGWARLIHLLVGFFLLLPLSIVSTYALLMVLYSRGHHLNLEFLLQTPVWYTLLGVCSFIIVLLSRLASSLLLYLYVVGHELTHALAAFLCGGKIHTLKIDAQGGFVETDKNNFFIGLAPYFLPLWLLVWVSLFVTLLYLFPFTGCEQCLYGGLGFWWGFHIYWTLWILPREQPDLLENGLFFSSLLIWVMNMVGLGLILSLFGLVSWVDYAQAFLESSKQFLRFTTLIAETLQTWL